MNLSNWSTRIKTTAVISLSFLSVAFAFQNCSGKMQSAVPATQSAAQESLNTAQSTDTQTMKDIPNTITGIENAIQTLQQTLAALQALNLTSVDPTLQQQIDGQIQQLQQDIATLQADLQNLQGGGGNSTYAWLQSGFGPCTNGVQTQTVVCQDKNGNVVSDSDCTAPKPATSQSCSVATNATCAGTWVGPDAGLIYIYAQANGTVMGAAIKACPGNSCGARVAISGTCTNGVINLGAFQGTYTSHGSVSLQNWPTFTWSGPAPIPNPWAGFFPTLQNIDTSLWQVQ